MRQQNKGMRVARSPFGGTLNPGGRPVVTMSIIGICVVAWLLQLSNSQVTSDFAFFPPLAESEPWRLITSAFLHSTSPLHIMFNMYALWITGPYLEQMFGRVRFAALYLTSALGGSIASLVLATPGVEGSWVTTTVGASGAVFGLFGAFFVVQRRLNRDATQILVMIAINFVIGFLLPNIAWQAHLGGLVTGVVVAAALAYAPRANRTAVQTAGIVGVLVLLAAAYAIKISMVPEGLLISL
ncbi:rhomboid family intramembrane serine protease [Kineosporia succinea]|uniref:Membrane associated rhomboid family serine protease n=1 Tax=Kineosporia succinea TaxID=84632 RepID=A0ABT9P176_9ACTN|nr:rhomboid family intramembrane serine protease [Kineosporia succinea]MDP9826321.1 membrane associated rhomboid family serine protease [Kineosporia succinea]